MSNRFVTSEDLINKGNSLQLEEQFEEALESYNSALELEQDSYEAYLRRSACHYSLKHFTGNFTKK